MVPTTSTIRIAYAVTSANRVASQLGQPWRRAQAPTGRTAMVSTSASIVGATIPAAPRMPVPRMTTPMTPTITVRPRGSGAPATPARGLLDMVGSAG